jgi:hypothetical protein
MPSVTRLGKPRRRLPISIKNALEAEQSIASGKLRRRFPLSAYAEPPRESPASPHPVEYHGDAYPIPRRRA